MMLPDATPPAEFVPLLRLSLVRHAQTTCSQAEVYCGRHCNPSLTAAGHAMAQELARTFQSVPFTALHTSPQMRAQQTMLPVAQAVGLVPTLEPALAELDYGDWDGATQASLLGRVPGKFLAWQKTPKAVAPPGGETAQMLWRRANRALARIAAQHRAARLNPGEAPAQNQSGVPQVLVVSHKSTLRVALCGLLGLDLDHYRTTFAWPLGAMAQLDVSATHVRFVAPPPADDFGPDQLGSRVVHPHAAAAPPSPWRY